MTARLLIVCITLIAAPVFTQGPEAPRELFVQVSAEFADAGLEAMLDAGASVDVRAAVGGTSPASVQAQIEELSALL